MNNLVLVHADAYKALLDHIQSTGSAPILDDLESKTINIGDNLERLSERLSCMTEYLNSKEIQELGCIQCDVEHGLSSLAYMVAFLEVVPEGEYDNNRGVLKGHAIQRQSEIEKQFTIEN